MIFLSQLLGKPVYYQGRQFGKIVDMAVFENSPHPSISKVELVHNKKRVTVSPKAVNLIDKAFALTTSHVPFLPYDNKDFYLAEDLLDKQVIDLNGRRLVRVNDVALESNGDLKVIGIDVGFPGILRRLGVGLIPSKSVIIPWEYIEAFDYDTGNIKIKTTEGKLSAMHPSEIAEILEDVGTKERLGIVAALDARKAARAIEETDNQTQISILEEAQPSKYKEVLNKMHVSELVDVLRYLNPLRKKEIQEILGEEKANRVKKLLKFPDDVAGGLMHPTFFAVNADKTVKEVIRRLVLDTRPPESIVVTNGNDKLVGVVYTKDLIITDPLAVMRDIVKDKKFVYPDLHFSNIFKLFTAYNLRALPVVDKEKKPIGLILIDDVLSMVEEQHDESD